MLYSVASAQFPVLQKDEPFLCKLLYFLVSGAISVIVIDYHQFRKLILIEK
jgi:hypothetical protein